MDLISRVAREDDQHTIRGLLDELSSAITRVQSNLDYIQPGQGAELCGLLFEMLSAASHRTKDDLLLSQAKKALRSLLESVKANLDDTQPDQCSRLYRMLAGAEFTIATRHSTERVQAARARAKEKAETEDEDEEAA